MPSRFWLLIVFALGLSGVQTSALVAAETTGRTFAHSNVPLNTPFAQAIMSQFQPEISPDRIFASRFETGEVLGAVPFTPPDPESILPPPYPTIFPSFVNLRGRYIPAQTQSSAACRAIPSRIIASPLCAVAF